MTLTVYGEVLLDEERNTCISTSKKSQQLNTQDIELAG